MARFLLLLRDNPADFESLSPGEMQRLIENYRDWTDRLAEQGVLELGEKLKDTGARHLARGGKVTVQDGPFTELKDVVSGLFILRAPDMETALKLTADSPHLAHGSIELRELEEV